MIRSFPKEKRLLSICYSKTKKNVKVFLKVIRPLEIKTLKEKDQIKKINEV